MWACRTGVSREEGQDGPAGTGVGVGRASRDRQTGPIGTWGQGQKGLGQDQGRGTRDVAVPVQLRGWNVACVCLRCSPGWCGRCG